MPVYRNDSSANIKVFDVDGIETILEPGDSASTNRYYDITDLTKTADEPFINPVKGYDQLTFAEAGAESVTLDSCDIEKVRIQNVTGTITVYLQDITNTPAALIITDTGTATWDLTINGNCDTIVVHGTSAAACDVVQMRGRQLL